MSDKPGFWCPSCGGTDFGSSVVEGEWVAHCHGPGCGWSGPHAAHVLPMEVRAERLIERGFIPSDAEQVEAFARRLFFADNPHVPSEAS